MKRFFLACILSGSFTIQATQSSPSQQTQNNFQKKVKEVYVAFMGGFSQRQIIRLMRKNSLDDLKKLRTHFTKKARRQSQTEQRLFKSLMGDFNSDKVKEVQQSTAHREVIDEVLKVLKFFIQKKTKAKNRLTLYDPTLHRNR